MDSLGQAFHRWTGDFLSAVQRDIFDRLRSSGRLTRQHCARAGSDVGGSSTLPSGRRGGGLNGSSTSSGNAFHARGCSGNREGDIGGAPEELLFRDRPLLASVVVWAALSVTILYLSR